MLGKQLLGVRGLARGRCAVSCVHPNGPTHGPPTSSAVLVNLGDRSLITKHPLLAESGMRLLPAVSDTFISAKVQQAKAEEEGFSGTTEIGTAVNKTTTL
jgi:hypothetical protein